MRGLAGSRVVNATIGGGLLALAALASCGLDSLGLFVPSDAGAVDVAADRTPSSSNEAGPSDAADEETSIPLVNSCNGATRLTDAWVADPKMCLTVFAANICCLRQIAFAPNGDLFAESNGFIDVLYDADGDGVSSPSERSRYAIINNGFVALNHGLVFSPDNAFIYGSSDTTVYRWAYKTGDRVASAKEEVVIANLPPLGAHRTRSLAIDAMGRLYVSVGSSFDVDTLPMDLATRSQIRRFTLPATLPVGGLDYATGEVFAKGLRNEVGITFDSKGRMWGVENGSDGIDSDNPAEELNRLDGPGSTFFGYPSCWSELKRDGGLGPGTQWSYNNGQTDAWCRDPANVRRPAAVMQGHWAPLGVTEYSGGSLPWRGDLVIAAHGSSGRSPAVGRLIARARIVGDVVQDITPVVGNLVDGGLQEGTWSARPVDVQMGPDGAIYFTDDLGQRIFRLGYAP